MHSARLVGWDVRTYYSLSFLYLPFILPLSPASGQIAFPEEPVNTTVLQNGRVSLRCVAVDTHLQRAHTSWRQSADGSLSNRYTLQAKCWVVAPRVCTGVEALLGACRTYV